MVTEQFKKDDVEQRRKAGINEILKFGSSIRETLSKRIAFGRGPHDESEHHDLIYQGKDVDLRKIPVAREMYLKRKDTVLGKRFRKTLLGYTKGATNQYRGPHSTHVREYPDHYTIHRDFIDPRKNPLSHLAKDAPMELAGWIIGGLIALGIIVFIIF